MEIAPPIPAASPHSSSRGRLAAGLGVLSALLLGASVLWAHHWGLLADTIVAGLAVATGAAAVVVVTSWRRGDRSRGVLFGLALLTLSVLALVGAGAAWAAGSDPAAGCGGG